jgi:hypothetical protein
MHRTTTLLTTIQRDWPLPARLSLIFCTTPPAWAIASAHDLSSRLNAGERARYQAEYPQRIAQLTGLRRRWYGTLALAALLAMAVIARAIEAPLDIQGMAIFAVTLYAILLPALMIQIGITYDYIASSALLQALRSTAGADSLEQPVSVDPMPDEPFVVAPVPITSSKAEYVKQEVDQREPLND